MSTIVQNNPNMLLKLSATSIAISMATAKLVNTFKERHAEIQKDREYLRILELAYVETSEEEKSIAESFTALSAEADKLIVEWSSRDGE